jgi:hypothetical protein
MATPVYTFFHAMFGLFGIGSGVATMLRLLAGRQVNGLPAVFFFSTFLTILTGFGFPYDSLLPTHIFGIFLQPVLVIAIPAYCMFCMVGAFRRTFVIGFSTALYLDVHVLIAHTFSKVQILSSLPPIQKESPLLITQGIVLALFVVLTTLATTKSSPERAQVH